MENLNCPSKEEILEKVSDIVAELFQIDKNVIKMDSLLEKDLGGDALDIIELIMTLEQVFGVSFPDEQFEPNVDEDEEEYDEDWDEDDCDDDYDDEEDIDFDIDDVEPTSEPYTLTIGDYVEFIHESLKDIM